MIRTRLFSASALLSCLFLAGCASFSSSDSGCIKTTLVTSLSKIPLSRVARGETRSVTLSHFMAGCGSSRPNLPGGEEAIGITVTLTAPQAKHPTQKRRTIALSLFVALLDREDNVLDRQDEVVKITLTDVALEHTHKLIYHPPAGIDVDSPDHRILVGFHEDGKVLACPKAVCAPVIKKPLLKKGLKGKAKLEKKRKLPRKHRA